MFELSKEEMTELVENCDQFKNLKQKAYFSLAVTIQDSLRADSIHSLITSSPSIVFMYSCATVLAGIIFLLFRFLIKIS